MAKIEKLKKDVEGVSTTIYPVTIPQAVIDPTSGKSSRVELDEKANHGYESNPKTLKSVDDAKADHGYESNPKSLKEVDDEKAAHGYGAEPQKTLKEVDDEVAQLVGDVSVKMTNVIANGDFRNGTTGWDTGGRGTVSIVGGYLNAMSNGSSNNVYVKTTAAMPLVAGDKIYSMMEARVASSIVKTLALQYDSSTNNAVTPIKIVSPPTINTWYNMSGIATIPSGYGGILRLYLFASYPTAAEGNGLSHQIKRAITINLTKVFGAGNEPTKEEFELLLSILGDEYFEGEITIPAQKVMQWELALIRKNKNAIIALGGSII